MGWDTDMGRGIEAEFARLEVFFDGDKKNKIHSAQAYVDPSLFLKKHLGIDVNGVATVATSKTSAPITLIGWELSPENKALVQGIISKAPGIFMRKMPTLQSSGGIAPPWMPRWRGMRKLCRAKRSS